MSGDHKAIITREVEDLREDYDVDVEWDAEPNFTHVIIRDWTLPEAGRDAYNKDAVDILTRVPDGYPNKPPDWIYTDRDLRLQNGQELRNSRTNRLDEWLALSYHVTNLPDFEWTPGETGLRWYLEVFTTMRFRQGD